MAIHPIRRGAIRRRRVKCGWVGSVVWVGGYVGWENLTLVAYGLTPGPDPSRGSHCRWRLGRGIGTQLSTADAASIVSYDDKMLEVPAPLRNQLTVASEHDCASGGSGWTYTLSSPPVKRKGVTGWLSLDGFAPRGSSSSSTRCSSAHLGASAPMGFGVAKSRSRRATPEASHQAESASQPGRRWFDGQRSCRRRP
jgi:hypothetical protein